MRLTAPSKMKASQSAFSGFRGSYEMRSNRFLHRPKSHTARHQNGFVQIVMIILLGIVFTSLGWVVITSLHTKNTSSSSIGLPEVSDNSGSVIPELTSDVLLKSNWSGPLILIARRLDGSYAYAFVRNAILQNNHFIGDVTLEYSNGDHGIVSEGENNDIPLFISKVGQGGPAQILQHLLTGVTLPDGSILPTQFTDAKIVNGKILGNFSAIVDVQHVSIVGDRSPSEKMLAMTVQPSLQTVDGVTTLLSRETLKMVLVPNGETNVLGSATDTGTSTGQEPQILASPQPFTGMILQRFDAEGVIRIQSQPVTSVQNITQQLSPQFNTINNVSPLQQAGSGSLVYFGGVSGEGGFGTTGATGATGETGPGGVKG